MPPELPTVSGRDVVRALERLGFSAVRQRGSHVVMRREITGCVLPLHRELKIGTLISVLKQAGIQREAFLEALR